MIKLAGSMSESISFKNFASHILNTNDYLNAENTERFKHQAASLKPQATEKNPKVQAPSSKPQASSRKRLDQ